MRNAFDLLTLANRDYPVTTKGSHVILINQEGKLTLVVKLDEPNEFQSFSQSFLLEDDADLDRSAADLWQEIKALLETPQ